MVTAMEEHLHFIGPWSHDHGYESVDPLCANNGAASGGICSSIAQSSESDSVTVCGRGPEIHGEEGVFAAGVKDAAGKGRVGPGVGSKDLGTGDFAIGKR